MGCARNGEVSGSKCKERRECGEMNSVKKRESVMIRESKNLTYSSYVQLICTVQRMEKVTEKGEQKPHIQFLCTAPLYSTKHTVVVIRIYIILITFTDHISFLLSKTSDQPFPYLNLLKKSGKRGICSIPKLY